MAAPSRASYQLPFLKSCPRLIPLRRTALETTAPVLLIETLLGEFVLLSPKAGA